VRSCTWSSHPDSRGAWPSIGVWVTPGPTALTRMPQSAHSNAATCTTMLSAAFDAQYTPMLRSTSRALTLLTATIEPLTPASIIARAAARIASITPFALTPRTRSHSAGSTSSSIPDDATPAHTVNSSGTPMTAIVVAMAASTWSGSLMSQVTSRSPATSHTDSGTPCSR
jgi:hypothetical protein